MSSGGAVSLLLDVGSLVEGSNPAISFTDDSRMIININDPYVNSMFSGDDLKAYFKSILEKLISDYDFSGFLSITVANAGVQHEFKQISSEGKECIMERYCDQDSEETLAAAGASSSYSSGSDHE